MSKTLTEQYDRGSKNRNHFDSLDIGFTEWDKAVDHDSHTATGINEGVAITYETILLEHNGDGVATLTLNRPERINSFTVQMAQEVRAAWLALRDDYQVVMRMGA